MKACQMFIERKFPKTETEILTENYFKCNILYTDKQLVYLQCPGHD